MKVLIVHAHPEPKSFNAALTERAVTTLAEGGHQTQVSDLYSMNWNPVSNRSNFNSIADPNFYRQQREEVYAIEQDGFTAEIRAEMAKLEWCDGLIFQFPLWWFGMPAILKGWIERVFAMGFAYGSGRWYDSGVFSGKRALLSLTTGSPATGFRADGLHGAMETLLYPVNHGVLRFTGFEVLPPFVSYAINHVGDEGRQAALDAYTLRLQNFWTDEPLSYPHVDEFDSETYQRKAVVNASGLPSSVLA